MKKIFTILLASSMAFTLCAQKDAVKKIEEMAHSDNQTMQHVITLTSMFGGRPIGSNAYDNARDWAAAQLEEWGYEVALEEAGQLACGFNRGPWWGKMYGDESATLHFVTPSYSVGTVGIERGPVVEEPRSTSEFNRIKGRLKGAWVLVDGQGRGFSILHDDSTRQQRHAIIAKHDSLLTATRQRTVATLPDSVKPDLTTPALFYDEMVEAGVLGFIQRASVPLQAHYDKNVVKGNLDFNHLPVVPDIKLDQEQYDRLRQLAKQRRNIILEFDIRNHFRMGPVPYHNVVATMKGHKKPNEYVIMGAHLDSYDSGTGAVDDGNGTAVLLEAARMLAKSGAKPDRTIIFILFAGEEFGLLGSQAWIERHSEMLPRISNMFNRDSGPMPYVSFSAPESIMKEFEPVAKSMNKLYPDFDFKIEKLEPRPTPTKTGGTDATSFMVKGVPAVQMNEWTDPKGYGFDYREIWHTERDIFNQSIPEYQQQAATAVALMLLQTANASKPFPRNEVYDDSKK